MPALAETLTTYPALAREWVAASETREFKRDFDGVLYLWEKTDITYDQVVGHVRRYLVEKLMKPTQQEMWVGLNGELDPEYKKRMQNAIDYWTERGDDRAVQQFSQELVGMENMALLVAKTKHETGSFPSVVVASHPGDFYVGENTFRKVVTNIGVEGREVADGYVYTYDTVPSSYMTLTDYYGYLQTVSDVNETEMQLQQTMGPLSAKALVSFPLLLNNHAQALEQLAKYLGYESWKQIKILADEQMLDREDPLAIERREEFVQELSRRLWQARERNNKQEVEDLSDTMGTLFAMENGSVYRGRGKDFVFGEVGRMLQLVVADRMKIFERRGVDTWIVADPDLSALWQYREAMAYIMQTNVRVQEGMATGCGGAVNFLQGDKWNQFSVRYQEPTYAGADMMQNFGFQENTATASVQSAQEITVSLSGGEKYTLTVEEGKKCVGCGAESGYSPLLRIGPCKLCEHCDPNVHRGD